MMKCGYRQRRRRYRRWKRLHFECLETREYLSVFRDTAVADFTAGSLDSNAYIAATGDGEVSSKPAAGAEFTGSELPAGWFSTVWESGGQAKLDNGQLFINGAMVGPSALYGPGRSLEFVATFSGDAWQHVGFGVDYQQQPWATFSTAIGGTLYARTAAHADTPIPGQWLGAPHRFRIDWTESSVVYWIDGAQVASHAATIRDGMRPLASDYQASGGAVAVDWIRLSPFASNGSFLSRVFDAGTRVTWSDASWKAITPPGTGVSLSVRMGDTATIDSNWTDFIVLAAPDASIGGVARYQQYRVDLTSSLPESTPVLEEVSITYTTDPDTVAPRIVGRSPGPGSNGIEPDSPVKVMFSELLDASTITPMSFRLRAPGCSIYVPATVSYAGSTAVLRPLAPLLPNTPYEVIVAGSVADAAGNPLGSTSIWSFTTRRDKATDTTVGDFLAGAPDGDAYVAQSGDGELMLAPLAAAEFSNSTLAPGWSQHEWAAGGSAKLSGGALCIDGARVGTDALYELGRSVEFVATFSGDAMQHVGFGLTFNESPWAVFSTSNGGGLYARTHNGIVSSDTLIAGNWLGAAHQFRIEWNAAAVNYWIDGNLVASHAVTISGNMRLLASDYLVGGPPVAVDWIRMHVYPASATFVSAVVDAGGPVTWNTVSWNSSTPLGTSLVISVRTGNSPTPDSTWSNFVVLARSGTKVAAASRYLQYHIGLATAVPTQTPVLQDITITSQIRTPHDTVPNFAQDATIISVATGAWSDPGTWSERRLPNALDVVAIGSGTVVTVDRTDASAETIGIYTGGQLRFRTDVDTRLGVGTLLVHEGGRLEVGSGADPVAAHVTAQIVIADQALDLLNDPAQYGTGLIGWGNVSMYGAAKSPTFVRLAVEPRKGATSLSLQRPVSGWQPGDRLILPDTRQLDWNERDASYTPQWEELTLASVSADGLLLTLTRPLVFDHRGARDANGTLEFLPHVGNLTRNVVVRSENPRGTRGHVMLTHRAKVDIRYAAFRDLGRTTIGPIDNTTFELDGEVGHHGTNQRWRYAGLHVHHLMGPATPPADGYQYRLIGNAVDNGGSDHDLMWNVTVHNSHYGLVQQNVVYNAAGAGVATEDGSESFNVFDNNFVVRVRGTGERIDDPGTAGAGYWLRGPNNYVHDNVAANIRGGLYSYGYNVYARYLGSAKVPAFQGADTSVAGQYVTVDMHATPLLEFARNEVYGATPNGMTVWWLGARPMEPRGDAGVIKDLHVWHHHNWGFFGYETNNLTIDGLVARGNTNLRPENLATGMWFGDYYQKGLIITNANIQGMSMGIQTPGFSDGQTTIRNSYFRNVVNISVVMMHSVNGSAGLPAKSTVIRHVKFDALPGLPLKAISMDYFITGPGSGGAATNLIQQDKVFVYDYNQVDGDNFQVYYVEQDSNFILPQTGSYVGPGGPLIGSPEAGLTNKQNWDKYGIAIAGGIAPPNTMMRMGIKGTIRSIVPGGQGLRVVGELANKAADSASLTDALLASVHEEAVARWQQVLGLDSAQVRELGNLTIHVADLPGSLLGLASTDVIWIDQDAAGHGWFVDATPSNDDQVTPAASDLPGAGQVDLLTALAHELGHILGFGHSNTSDVMHEVLEPGTQRVPDSDALRTVASQLASFGSIQGRSRLLASPLVAPVARETVVEGAVGRGRVMAASQTATPARAMEANAHASATSHDPGERFLPSWDILGGGRARQRARDLLLADWDSFSRSLQEVFDDAFDETSSRH